jgi:hypothetical protein
LGNWAGVSNAGVAPALLRTSTTLSTCARSSPPLLQGFCTSLNWASNILIGATFPVMLSALGIAGSYLVFAAFCAFGAWFLAGRMVETKRQPVERIRAMMLGPKA